MFLLHLAEWLDIDYDLDVTALNEYWTQPENIKTLSFLHVKNIHEAFAKPIPTGVYRIEDNGEVFFDRPANNPHSLQSDKEIFWFSSSSQDSKIKRGEELGGLFIRSRVTDDSKNLNKTTMTWLGNFLKEEVGKGVAD